jgi:hypothetical protein
MSSRVDWVIYGDPISKGEKKKKKHKTLNQGSIMENKNTLTMQVLHNNNKIIYRVKV